MEFGIRGASNVLLLSLATNEPVMFLPQITFSHLNMEGNFVPSTGGRQGMNLVAWNENSQANFRIRTPIFSMKFLKISSGSSLSNKEIFVHEIESLEIDEDNKVKLKFIPSDKKSFFIFELNVSGQQIVKKLLETDYSIDEDVITITASLASDWVLVYYYHKTLLEIVEIGKSVNSGYYSLIGETTIYNQNTTEEELLKFQFPKIEIQYQFDLQMLNAENPDQFFAMDCAALVDNPEDMILLRLMKIV